MPEILLQCRMANQRGTFAKRRREQELQDRARAKHERRVARRSEPRLNKGPEIAWDQAVHPAESPMVSDEPAPPESSPRSDDADE
jgi:hypothetical protein